MRKRVCILLKNNPVILSLSIITFYSILSYFPFIPFLGFYNDDWLFSYIGHFYGSLGLIGGFAGDRPLVGYLFALNHILLNNNVLLWHIYMLLMRFLGGYILFFLLKRIWPNRLSIMTSITLLFLIYPGFLQQTLPLGYQNYMTALTIWITSLYFTVLAVKNHNRILITLFTLFALILQIISFLLLEFFIGMEILRLILILYLIIPTFTGINFIKLKKKIGSWSPYIISLVVFILWRIFIFKSAREATDISWITKTYYLDYVWIAKIPLKILYSFFSTIVLSYFIPIVVRLFRLPLESSIISLSVGIISSITLLFYYRFINKAQSKKDLSNQVSVKKFGKNLLLVGIISIFAALVPIIFSGRFVSEFSNNDNFDRYSISSIIGVPFVIVGLLLYKSSNTLQQWIMICLIGISITTHLMNGYWYAIYWDKQKDIWWQLYWRAPKIENNSMLIFDFPKDPNIPTFKDTSTTLYKSLRLEDYQIWAPGNLFLNYSNAPMNHFRGQYLPNENVNRKIRNKTIETIAQESSTIKYTNNFNNTIMVSLPSEKSCLWVLDKERGEIPDNSSELLKSNLTYSSDINKIIKKAPTAFTPPTKIFGNEPFHTWCYYFQKVSLARQLKDWDKVNEITQQVLEKDLKPKDSSEWLPFIEGLMVYKKYSQAESLIKVAFDNRSKVFANNLCQMLNRLDVIEFKNYCN